MNTIILKGKLLDIRPSHKIGNVDYSRANLQCDRKDNKKDYITLCFKKLTLPYSEGDEIELVGNIRSFSRRLDNGKNKVSIYVNTYFDKPETIMDSNNACRIDGNICKIGKLEKSHSGKYNLHFILANNIEKQNNQKLNSYIPCVAWGDIASKMCNLKVGDKISITGQLHSREYKKLCEDGEYETRIAHELVALEYSIII